MAWLDIAILALIVLSAVLSLFRGFVREALSLLAWVAAFVIAHLFVDTGSHPRQCAHGFSLAAGSQHQHLFPGQVTQVCRRDGGKVLVEQIDGPGASRHAMDRIWELLDGSRSLREVASVLLAWLTYYGAALAALRRLDLEKLSPMDAFMWLNRIKKQLED